MANVIVVSETPQRVIIRDEAATRTVKVVSQGPQGPVGSVNPQMFTLRDQAQASADSAAIDASTAQSSSASAFASANAAAGSAASVLASQQAAATSATQASTSASQAATSATSAGTSETNAQASATSAASSATSAQTSADAAINKANIADAAAASATGSAATATTKATEAATSATNAASSATSASTSATTATTKATQASTSATLAQDWAIKTVGPVSGAEYSSKYHAQAASASAGSASSSANAAAASATTAGTKAGEASASAASALDSKDVASVAAQFAVNAQSAAQTSANAALASKNAAATSATSASDSATAASNSATAAAGSATSAGNSATGASSSAVAAAGSAATATTKASEASTSATNAAASATAAATSATNTANALVGERSAVATLTNKTITSPVIDSGAANGVAYLNSSKVLTAGSGLTFDASGTLSVPKQGDTYRAAIVLDSGSQYSGTPSPAIAFGGANTNAAIFSYRLAGPGGLLAFSTQPTSGGDPVARAFVTANGNFTIGESWHDAARLVIKRDAASTGVFDSASIVLSNRNQDINGGIMGGIFADTYRDAADPHYVAGIWFTRKATSWNLSSASEIVFGAQSNNGAGAMPLERMRLNEAGQLLIGTSAAQGAMLKVNGALDVGVIGSSSNSYALRLAPTQAGTNVGNIAAMGNGISFRLGGSQNQTENMEVMSASTYGVSIGSTLSASRLTNVGAVGAGEGNARNHFVSYNAGSASMATGWIAAAFGDATAPRPVIGSGSGKAIIGAHNGDLTHWAPLHFGATEHIFTSDIATERARIDSSGNLGLGVVPSTNSLSRSLDLAGGAGLFGYSGQFELSANAYYDSGWRYKAGNFAALYEAVLGQHIWKTAPSGVAGSPIPFTQAMTLDANGKLLVGRTAALSGSVALVEAEGRYSSVRTGWSAWSFGTINGDALAFTIDDASTGAPVERLRIDHSGNLGLGVAPSAWGAYRALQAGPSASLSCIRNSQAVVSSGAYNENGAGWKHMYSSVPVAKYEQYLGGHYWSTAPSGTAGQPISFTLAMTLDASGNLLVGTTSTYGGRLSLRVDPGANDGLVTQPSSDNSYYPASFKNNAGSFVGAIGCSATATSYNTSSDYRLKNITGPITNSGAYIDSLNPVEGSWKADGSTFVGLIAHEVQEASRTQVATGVKDGEEVQAMDYSASELIANMIAELKSLRARVAALETT